MNEPTPSFPHDYYSTRDDKTTKLLMAMGAEGYGIFWLIVERLYISKGRIEADYVTLSFDLRVEPDKIKKVVTEFNLFYLDGKMIASHSVDRRLKRGSRQADKEKKDLVPLESMTPLVQTAKALTPIQRVVNAYKEAKGVKLEDKAWDKANFGRYSKSAKGLIECFGSWERAAVYILVKGQEFDDKELSWTLETISKHAWDDRGKHAIPETPLGANAVPAAGGRNRAPSDGNQTLERSIEILGRRAVDFEPENLSERGADAILAREDADVRERGED